MCAEVSAAPFREPPQPHPPTGRGQGHALFSSAEWRRLGAVLRLSRREIEIAQGVFDDRKDEQIAHQLDISRHTVNTYLHRLYKKLQVGSRPQLIVKVMREYLRQVAGEEGEPSG
jgi:DNA-binding CsgD family transcriptional regulator